MNVVAGAVDANVRERNGILQCRDRQRTEGGGTLGAQQSGGCKPVHFVDQALAQQSGRQLPPSLDENLRQPRARQQRQRTAEVEVATTEPDLDQPGARAGERPLPARGGLRGAEYPRSRSLAVKQPSRRRHPQARIEEYANARVEKLSSGMKQKVSIARTIAHDPPVLIFDEPTVGLDVLNALEMVKVIRELKAEGKTILFSSHIMSEVEKLCDRIAIIHPSDLKPPIRQ